ncbi:Resolvase, N-terminal domain [Magnetococcus marinus MC-1]|uniref:Resolvase, N-terminal domain n=1 Tax=Magnetococcus marinus (strain ATCC BAA-1437 / JCM 17883 / MC-1) TaxID=156889 RepID=A0LB21_MAGMM|nr:recombinase family protein [Magnetococcus marinus]ABK45164.1 Resolvase, N-terminal domain [Magnetococcus marinus MC-1]
MKNKPTKKIRCAIYTRKSTEEGLEQQFNSLDAQRESCESYIISQKAEGWTLVPDHYSDGGFSGGNMNRPALNQLLNDIKAGRIDCVCVYKIDRLSRSLVDFTKMVELFDQHNVTFVSITQSFNTTTSMGRLTLNVLLSFAQFEREVASERIRDKLAASRKKGMWMGGHPPLGYDVENRKLVINQKEADLVRHIYDRFAKTGSTTLLVKELAEQGLHTKSYTAKTGRVREGKPIDKGYLYRILGNLTYLGEVVTKGETYPGEHDPIITLRQWEKAQSVLNQNKRPRSTKTRADTPFPLKGIITCEHCGRAMTTTYTRKKGKMYRYYTCTTAIKKSYDACPMGNIAAGEIEELVLCHIENMIRSPELVAKTWQTANDTAESNCTENSIITTLQNLEPVWEELFPLEQARLLQLLVRKVMLSNEQLQVHLRVEGLTSLVDELNTQEAA